MNARRLIGASLLVVACVGVTGCDPNPGPVVTESLTASPSPTASESASATPTPSASPLTPDEVLALLPPEARTSDLAGAKATAEFFVELYGTMLQTGDTRLWDALSGPECEFCADSSQTAEGYVNDRVKVEGGQVSIDSNRGNHELRDDGFAYVALVVDQQPLRLTSSDGSVHKYDGGEFGIALQLAVVDGAWVVAGGQVIDPAEVSR